MRAPWLLLGVALLALALWRREDIAEGVASVYYATTEDTRENEANLAPVITSAEGLHGIPRGLLHRLIYQETRFRSDIINGWTVGEAGAVGVGQIVPKWHPDSDPYSVNGSVYYAAAYLAQLYRSFGSWRQALAAYNWGPGNLRKHLAQHGELTLDALPEETRDYVVEITADVEVA